jgi:hypothetical protein
MDIIAHDNTGILIDGMKEFMKSREFSIRLSGTDDLFSDLLHDLERYKNFCEQIDPPYQEVEV